MQRPQFVVADLASTTNSVRGQALTNQFATQAAPEQQDKRVLFTVSCTTSGTTPAELVIEGQSDFRIGIPGGTASLIEYMLVGITGVSAHTHQSGRGVVSVQNTGGVVTQQGAAFANVSTLVPTVAVTVDNATQTVRFTVTPAAGTVGTTRWTGMVRIIDVSDEG